MNFSFDEIVAPKTDNELLAIIKAPQEYQESFVLAAETELRKRGIDFTEIKMKTLAYRERLETLDQQGKPGDQILITLGFIFSVLGGLLGIIIGGVFRFSTKKGMSGYTYPVYNANTRQLGSAMILISVVMIIFSVVYRYSE